MLRPLVNIKIQQMTPYSYKDTDGKVKTIDRGSVINLDFVEEYIIDDSWTTHTNTCKIVFPKNIILKTDSYLFKQSGTYNVILGGVSNIDKNNNPIIVSPLLMRGDIVEITDGYRFFNAQGIEQTEIGISFKGFISKVHSDIPIEIECEDNFFLLKKIPIGKTSYRGSLLSLCKDIANKVNEEFYNVNSFYPKIVVNDKIDDLTAQFSLGYLDIDYDTMSCGMVLNKLRQQYHLESYFINNVLYFGNPIYNEDRAISKYFFNFQNNIIKEDLEYTNKEDIVLSAVVSCQTISKTNRATKLGLESTKRSKLKVYVYWDIITETFKSINIDKGEKIPPNEGGERHEFVYPIDRNDPIPTFDQLSNFGISQLKKYYYTGFRGSLTTFGYPRITWNDNVNLTDDYLADRNGQYKVKRVIRKGGIKGIKQEIFLDFKQNVALPNSTYKLSMI